MTSISTAGLWARIQQANLLTQNRIDFYNQQIASGLKGNTFGDFSPSDSRLSLDLRPVIARIDVQQRGAAAAKARTEVMEVALRRMDEIAKSLENDLTFALGSTEFNMSTVNQRARQALDEIAALLNTQHQGRFLFAGAQTGTAPVSAAALQQFADFARVPPQDYAGNVAAYFNGLEAVGLRRSTAGAPAAPPLFGATTFQVFDPAVTGAANDVAVSVRLEDDVFTQLYGVPSYTDNGPAGNSPEDVANRNQPQNLRADAFPFRQLMIGLAAAAGLTNPRNPDVPAADGLDRDAFRQLVEGARSRIKEAREGIALQTGILGNTAQKIEATRVRLEQTQNTLQKQLGQAEDVDVAQTISKLQLSQIQLQASFNVTSTLRQLTIVNFL